MLVMTGGRGRTEAACRNLLRAGGFELTQVVSMPPEFCVIEGYVLNRTSNLDSQMALPTMTYHQFPKFKEK